MLVITGAAGFIGRTLLATLNERGREDLLAVDSDTGEAKARRLAGLRFADLLDKHEFRRALGAGCPGWEVDAILHEGACTDTWNMDEAYLRDNNFKYSEELLRFALERGIPFIYASSAAVYGRSDTFVEDPRFEEPLNPYGRFKKDLDDLVRQLAPRVGSTVVGLRYFNVYGPGEQHKGHMASIPYQLFRELRSAGTATIFTGVKGRAKGEQSRDFVHVSDAVGAVLHFLQAPPVQGVFNVGTGAARSYNDVAGRLMELMGGGGRVRYEPLPDGLRSHYQGFTQADTTRRERAGLRAPFRTLEEGMALSLPAWLAE